MRPIQLMKRLLVRFSGSPKAQDLLERGVVFAQDLMGIGSGSSPHSSGETVLAGILRRQYAAAAAPLCVFDVGSNEGQFLEEVFEPLQHSGLPLQVHAFEPSQAAYQVLHDRFQDRPDLRLNHFGLGKQNGEFELFANAPGSGLASLSRRRLDHFGIGFDSSERVAIRKLDDYCLEQGVERIDLLKMDVEGHELDVLEGGARMFRERRIRLASFEFGGGNIDSRTFFQDFWYFFTENGPARLYRITPAGSLAPLPEYREVYEQFRTTNFLVMLPEA
jgi:FkbM family methyltransferase